MIINEFFEPKKTENLSFCWYKELIEMNRKCQEIPPFLPRDKWSVKCRETEELLLLTIHSCVLNSLSENMKFIFVKEKERVRVRVVDRYFVTC